MSVALRWLCSFLLAGVVVVAAALPSVAQEPVPRYGLALLAGAAYNPDQFGLVLLQGNIRLPYGQVFWHDAPDSLYFQGEINLGITTDGRNRGVAAVNMMAVKYLENWRFGSWTPYIEGGIGVIYTDFRVSGQGLRINFNPQIGVGVESLMPRGKTLAIGLRLHHLSNANLYRDNRGVDSVLLSTGVRF